MKLNAKNFGLAFGILWGFSVLIMTLISLYTRYAEGFLRLLSEIYPGYKVSLVGSFIGCVYGFVDGFIGFYLFALIYNFLQKE